MNFRVEFEVASLFLIFILILYSLMKTKYKDEKFKVFIFYAVFTFFDVTLDIITIFTIKYSESVPLFLNQILNGLYLTFQLIMPSLFIANVYIINSAKERKSKRILLWCIPSILCIVFLWTTNFTLHTFFYFENGKYFHGSLHNILYINMLYYLILAITITLVKNYRKERINTKIIFYSLFIVCLLVGAQFIFQTEILSGYGVALSLLIIYLSFQVPEKKMDSMSGALNANTFQESFDQQISKKEKKLFKYYVFNFLDYDLCLSNKGLEKTSLILKSITDFSCAVFGANNVFRIFPQVMVFGYDNEEQKNKINKLIRDELKKDFFQYCFYDVDDVSIFLSADEFQSVVRECMRKKNKSGMVETIRPDMIIKAKREIDIDMALKNILKTRKIEMHYQPIFNVKEGRTIGAEALARLSLPEYGYISPMEFISIAEDKNYINELGMIIIENVYQFMEKTQISRNKIEYMDINLSSSQLADSGFIHNLETLTRLYHISKYSVRFEITEGKDMVHNQIVLDGISKMVALGYSLSLDDFGTGYSTLECVTNLPFQCIKIDKSLISQSLTNLGSKIMLESLIQMFQKLKKRMIVEGIETEELVRYIGSLGIENIQGYYYSKPLTETKLIEYFQEEVKKREN